METGLGEPHRKGQLMAQITINAQKVAAWGGAVRAVLSAAGIVLAAALAVDALIWSVPYLGGGGQERMLLAALLVYAGR